MENSISERQARDQLRFQYVWMRGGGGGGGVRIYSLTCINCISPYNKAGFDWLVVLGLTALSDSISV